jgi:hypothetical protein
LSIRLNTTKTQPKINHIIARLLLLLLFFIQLFAYYTQL